jgi:adenine-specific DNA-methyltransferase
MPILTWLTRETDLQLSRNAPYRLLEPVPEQSFGDPETENMLIQGDNLDALKALLPYYAGRVKCIYIDPPYNTRSAFEQYDDNLEHSKWLSLMYPRMELLRELLSEDGSIWVSIDDNEGHYLKVIMDEIFGRKNFIASVIWIKTSSVHNNAEFFSSANDTIHVFAKNIEYCKFGRIPRSQRNIKDYTNPDNDPRGLWTSSPLHVSLTSGQRGASYAKTGSSSGLFPIISPLGQEISPPKGRCWGYSQESIHAMQRENRIWWGPEGKNQPRIKRYLLDLKEGVVPTTVWVYQEVGHNQEAKKEMASLLEHDASNLFSTPKPERLIQRILVIMTNPGDLLLDSFLGSGTTCAVAHKMGRRYIGVEMGEHAVTHCVPRLKKVIEGEQGGISNAVNWQGGGGFRFYRLGEPVFDQEGKINKTISFATLAAHVWFSETGIPLAKRPDSPWLGAHNGTGYYLLYNGILGDKRPDGGNVLTGRILQDLPPFDGPKVVYGETSRLGAERLRGEHIVFKQIPYEIKAR